MNGSRVVLAFVVLLAAVGCGSGDNPSGVTFVGTVTSVTPQQAMREAPARRWLAKVESLVLPSAVAQSSSCPAKHVLACASNGISAEACNRVEAVDCQFSVSVPSTKTDFAGGAFGFVDDANDNGAHDSGETIAFLFAALGRLCEGTVVHLEDVQIDFTPGSAHATAGTVRKDPDTCANTTPGPTPTKTPGPSPTPTSYSVAAPLNRPPSTMLAMLYGAGAVGLLLPVRRRRRRR